ncbi:MAG: hypothetical protein HZB81_05025, partial [Deltaproteobacteria bacterium]|nr:hypothetical protein [Deltaproteobacteria bacterium]
RRLNELIEDTSIPVTVPIEMKEAGCIGCHEKVYSSMLRYSHQHPRASEECQMCHITDLAAAREIPANVFSRENIVFLDVSDIVKYRVKVKLKDKEGREAASQDIDFTPSSVYERMVDDKKPPLISNLKVEELKAGIFYSAVITWETDEPSTSQVQYGLSSKYGDASLLDDKFTKEHVVIIDKLIPDEKYHIIAISKDPFENTTRSDDFTFKVKKPFLEKQEEPPAGPSVEGVKVVKIGNKTALSWRANKKTGAVIYLVEVVSRKNIISKEPHYPGLTTKRISHPTGLLSWLKVAPSPDLPLGTGSVMLCVTCHTPHGGEHEHILIKEESKLCTSCHTEKR